jgi:hypothetical protein
MADPVRKKSPIFYEIGPVFPKNVDFSAKLCYHHRRGDF